MFGIVPVLSKNTVNDNCEIATIIPRGTSLRLGKSACFCYYPAVLTCTRMAGKYCIYLQKTCLHSACNGSLSALVTVLFILFQEIKVQMFFFLVDWSCWSEWLQQTETERCLNAHGAERVPMGMIFVVSTETFSNNKHSWFVLFI